MKVSIKKFAVAMDIKNSGIELDVYTNDGVHRGDLVINKASLIWCAGRTTPQNGKRISWDDFTRYMESR
jgi:hypothetical protein